jgi:hypothetical protein
VEPDESDPRWQRLRERMQEHYGSTWPEEPARQLVSPRDGATYWAVGDLNYVVVDDKTIMEQHEAEHLLRFFLPDGSIEERPTWSLEEN